MLHLIPQPQKVQQNAGVLALDSLENVRLPENVSSDMLGHVTTLADELENLSGKRLRFCASGVAGKAIELKRIRGDQNAQSYSLCITPDGIQARSSGGAGLFYAVQTLRQLIRDGGTVLPCMDIADKPDFPVRGFYHDCARGKIPSLKTLFALADKLAYYKINQMQLYIEHTFAFARHSDMWAGADPLTAEEILHLDAYCRARHVELVPSLSTFGHFYIGLRSKRKEHLNELDVRSLLGSCASELPFSFCARMDHYTLNASDPGSLKLIEDMLDEFLPLFSSKYCNICCDETFDLGHGKNRQLVQKLGSRTKLYTSFLKKIIQAVNRRGRIAMFWNDIIIEEPALAKELPPDTIQLEWDYTPDASLRDSRLTQAGGLPLYICPGCSGWNTFLNNIHVASQNIINYAKKGRKFKAGGLLNTDWGDFGHINLLGNSFHGMALGAACGWNTGASADRAAFDEAFSILELGDRTGNILKAWQTVSEKRLTDYRPIEFFVDPNPELDPQRPYNMTKNITPEQFAETLDVYARSEADMMAAMVRARPLDGLVLKEILAGIRGDKLLHLILAAILGYPGYDPRKIADELRAFETQFTELWHLRNKPSEYYRIRTVLSALANKLDGLSTVKKSVKKSAVKRHNKK